MIIVPLCISVAFPFWESWLWSDFLNYPEKLPHSWKCWRPAWVGLGTAWVSGRCPCPWILSFFQPKLFCDSTLYNSKIREMEKRWSKTQSELREKVKWELLDLKKKKVGVEDGIIFKITAGMFRCHWSSEQLAVRKKGTKDMQSEEQLVLSSTTQS